MLTSPYVLYVRLIIYSQTRVVFFVDHEPTNVCIFDNLKCDNSEKEHFWIL